MWPRFSLRFGEFLAILYVCEILDVIEICLEERKIVNCWVFWSLSPLYLFTVYSLAARCRRAVMRRMSHAVKYCLSNQSGVMCCRLLLLHIAMTKYMNDTQLTYLTKISFCPVAIQGVIPHNKSSIKRKFIVMVLPCRPLEVNRLKFSNGKNCCLSDVFLLENSNEGQLCQWRKSWW